MMTLSLRVLPAWPTSRKRGLFYLSHGRVTKKLVPSPAVDSQRMLPPSALTQSIAIEMRVGAKEAVENGRLIGFGDAEAVVTHANRAGRTASRLDLVGGTAGGDDFHPGRRLRWIAVLDGV